MAHATSKPQTHGQEDSLALSANTLREAIDAEAPGHERQWAEAIDRALAEVEMAIRKHLIPSKDPTAEVDQTRPSLARQADELRSEHGDLLAAVHHLREQVQRVVQAFQPAPDVNTRNAPGIVDLGALRREAEQLLTRLHEHREAEINLIQESVVTDIGVGD